MSEDVDTVPVPLSTEAAQLEVLTGPLEPKTVTIETFDGTKHEFALEEFSTYKTAQVLKMLAATKNSNLDLAALLQDISKASSASILIRCPHCKTTIDKREATYIPKQEFETIGCENCKNPFAVKDALPAIQDNSERTSATVNIVQTLLTAAPDLVLDFAALAIISNAELASLYDKPNGIANLRAQNRKMLELECRADSPMRILRSFLPSMGFSFLISELAQMDKTFALILAPVVPK